MKWTIPEQIRKRVTSPVYLGWSLAALFFALYLRAIDKQFPAVGNLRVLIYLHTAFVCYVLSYGGKPEAED
jgi:hypothetical protein